MPNPISLLQQLVEIESFSRDKAGVDKLGAFIAEECRKLGANVEIVENPVTGNQVVAHFLPSPNAPFIRGGAGGGVLLMHHMDTVYPPGTLATMPFYEKDGKIFGPGVMDMKGGIVISLTAIAELQAAGKLTRPVTALFTSDEEIGSHTSRALIEELARKAALVLVFESGLLDGSLKTWRKGMGVFTVKVKGRAAHAGGKHQDGRNAIEELAHQVLAIQKLTDYAKGTTFNVGMIRGGTASNVVPEHAEAVVDFRVLIPEETERVYSAMYALKPVTPDTTIEVSGELNRPPMPFDTLMQSTFARAQEIASGIGMTLKAGGSGGGSDGNFVAPLGISLLDGLGACGEGHHSDREYILAESLPQRVKLLSALIKHW